MSFFDRIKHSFQTQEILTQLIIVNAAVFLTVNVIGSLSHIHLVPYLSIPTNGSEFMLKFWTLFTYMYTHENLMHIFWNMITLYFMAQTFLIIMGQKKLLYLYVMSGLCGGALVLIFAMLFPESFGNAYLLGASAAVLGVGAVMAVYSPDYRVYLFGAFEMPYKYFYLLLFALSTLIDLSINTGGKISHIGGAIYGLAYGYYLKRGIDITNFSFVKKKKTPLKVVSRNASYQQTNSSSGVTDEHRMNELLDKISKSGYDSLTKTEKEDLFKLSKKK